MDRSSVTLERMRSFVRVVERGSLSAVAREEGVGQSTVSRHVAELEAALGASLLNRTTRRLTLTDEGRRFHAEARTILRLVDEATDGVRNAGGGLTGTVRVSCTAALGVRHVCRALFVLQDRYPGISIDLSLTDERIDLVREATDVAIRLGPLAESSLQRKAIGRSRRILVASRGYLADHGRPQHPADLSRHLAIRMSNVAGSDTLCLHGPDGATARIPVGGRLLVDHGLAAREALAQGRGIAAAHVWLVDDLLAAGAIEQVLPDHAPEPVPLSILVVPSRIRIKRVRLVVDALAAALAELPGLDRP
ncbi:DNA-binding transcriptional LysR family regulator [Methylobacterium brachiatum]|uniref:DNA-binding transcriptional LysR family regulator n=1 Tax=Methylobacterium brachiatum TaxID=269660 RepID=A0AAJ1WXC0_9HYPH|nr:LysR family transcriptional regulator [Methylobacterium brachiatum]MCB4805409.1 LysR family transcriptional regulator [Methylobacterium brachiatum]MDQ0546464.1 DNA-binding transcriptional LysR family regulator [Methylobacterium brachiatum]